MSEYVFGSCPQCAAQMVPRDHALVCSRCAHYGVRLSSLMESICYALPTASEEQIRIASAVLSKKWGCYYSPRAREIALAALSGRLDCQYCAVPCADCPYPDSAHGIDFCGDWRPRDTEGSE